VGDPLETQEVKRKLAAILSADVKGYSRLMGDDEKGTIRTLNTYKELTASLIQKLCIFLAPSSRTCNVDILPNLNSNLLKDVMKKSSR